MKLRITLDIDVDAAEWGLEYNVRDGVKGLRDDVLSYVVSAVTDGTYAFIEGELATVEFAKIAGRRG